VAPDARTRTLQYHEGPDKVRQSIELILATEPGERVMRPAFGCGLQQYLMTPNTPATRAAIERDVLESLSTWEPRISVTDVEVSASPTDPSLVFIGVRYVHVRDGQAASMVLPLSLG